MSHVDETLQAKLQSSAEGSRRFHSMTYGVTAHWGLYSVLGRDEWAMHLEHIPVEEYEQLVPQFNPVYFDAQKWVDALADGGAEALMITTKHHDGFCLYNSALTTYTVASTPCKRDLIGELAEACQRRNIALHLYYSLLDWHHPAYRNDWDAYLAYYQGQIRELCTNYGPIAGFAFDGYWPRVELAPDQAYFAQGGVWDLAGTYDTIHTLHPDAVIVNNHHILPLPGEDYQVSEIDLPGENTLGFNTKEVSSLPLASWFPVNRGWSYRQGEQAVKPAEELLRLVMESRKRNATCWFNIGPLPDGTLLPAEVAELQRLGQMLH